jgi:hypothetical protein
LLRQARVILLCDFNHIAIKRGHELLKDFDRNTRWEVIRSDQQGSIGLEEGTIGDEPYD